MAVAVAIPLETRNVAMVTECHAVRAAVTLSSLLSRLWSVVAALEVAAAMWTVVVLLVAAAVVAVVGRNGPYR
jgi:hypothetical protein